MKLHIKPSIEEINVLAVDDNQEFTEILKRKLEQHSKRNINLESVTNPKRVLDKLKHKNYDIVIADYRMPEMDGLELLKKIRKEYNSIPVIIETNNYRPEVERKAYTEGATAFMRKSSEDEHYEGILRHMKQETVHYRSCKKSKS